MATQEWYSARRADVWSRSNADMNDDPFREDLEDGQIVVVIDHDAEAHLIGTPQELEELARRISQAIPGAEPFHMVTEDED
jgi:hypothetical protein